MWTQNSKKGSFSIESAIFNLKIILPQKKRNGLYHMMYPRIPNEVYI